jgi:hypothetical protein
MGTPTPTPDDPLLNLLRRYQVELAAFNEATGTRNQTGTTLPKRPGSAPTGVIQQELAKRLRRPQFVSKFENGERGLDVVEFVKIAHLVGFEPGRILKAIE